ncbi:MAG: ABC transporter substrate-binding protein [Anaerotignaceae bacterium]
MEKGNMIMKKGILLLLMSAVIFAGCGNTTTTTQTAIENKTEENTTVETQLEDFDIILDWYPNAVHGFIYEAIEKGYYAEEGLKVNVRFPSNTNDAISLTAAGKADAGIYYMHDLIRARADQNIPIKSLGAICQSELNVILSLKEHNITSPADLIGKTVGTSGSELSEGFIKYIVENSGGKIEDVNIVDVGFDLMSSMTTKNVDATIGCMVNHEVPQMEEEGFEVNYFYSKDYGVPDYYELLLVTGETQLENNSEKLEKFIRASKKGFEDMKNNPEESVDILINNQNEENFPLNKTVELKSTEMLLPVMETAELEFLGQKAEVWEESINWLYESGFISKTISAEEVMAN